MATLELKAPTAIPQDLQEKIIHLAVLKARVFQAAAAYKKLSVEIAARLAAEVRS